MADDIYIKTDEFYTKGMKPQAGEGVNTLWARKMASNTGACYFFRNYVVDNVSFGNNEEKTYDTDYDWSSRWALIIYAQDNASLPNSFSRKISTNIVFTDTTVVERMGIQLVQLTASYTTIAPIGDAQADLQIKYESGGGFTIKNNQASTAYITMVLIAVKRVA